MAKHSIAFGTTSTPYSRLLILLKDATHKSNLKPGTHYTLSLWSKDESTNNIISLRENLPRGQLFDIIEAPETYNDACFPVWASTAELTLNVRRRDHWIELSLIADNDLLEEPGLGETIKIMGTFMDTLEFNAALLCDQSDEGEVGRRIRTGTPLSSVVLSRVHGQDALPVPLLALVREELCDAGIWEEAAARGLRINMTPAGHLLFSSVS